MLYLMFQSYRVVIPAFLANNDLMNPGYCGLHVRDFFYLCGDESSIMYQWFIESIPVSGFFAGHRHLWETHIFVSKLVSGQ